MRFLAFLVAAACGAAYASIPAADVALVKKTVGAIELSAASLTTAVRQKDMNDFRRFITGPVEAQLDAIRKLPRPQQMELIQCVTAGVEFTNRAEDSMKAGQVKPANSLEKESLAACKSLK